MPVPLLKICNIMHVLTTKQFTSFFYINYVHIEIGNPVWKDQVGSENKYIVEFDNINFKNEHNFARIGLSLQFSSWNISHSWRSIIIQCSGRDSDRNYKRILANQC